MICAGRVARTDRAVEDVLVPRRAQALPAADRAIRSDDAVLADDELLRGNVARAYFEDGSQAPAGQFPRPGDTGVVEHGGHEVDVLDQLIPGTLGAASRC